MARPHALAIGLGLAASLLPGRATAACTGTDATELTLICDVVVGASTVQMRIDVPPGTIRSTDEGTRPALYRLVVVVRGYGDVDLFPEPVAFEDGTGDVVQALLDDKISVAQIVSYGSDEATVEDAALAFRGALDILDIYRTEAASPLVVIGHSMGGLVTRIALADMEAAQEPHDVALWVSYDAPHSGVNTPHGMQMLKVKLDEWAAMTEEDFIAIDPGWEGVFDLASLTGMSTSLETDSIRGYPDPTTVQAQQMTIQGVVHPEAYTAFMALLDAKGFPEQPHTVGITNGNTLGVGNTQAIGPGDELFWFSGAKGNSAASVRGTFQVFTDDPGEYSFRSDVYYDGFFQNHDGGQKNATTPAGTVAMDHFSGGTIDWAQEMRQVAEANADDFHEPSWRAADDSALPFVPTWSALALPVGTADADIAGIVATGGAPFDDVYAIGDLDVFGSNVDHNTWVLPDAILDEIATIMACPLPPEGDVDGDGVDDACDDNDDNDAALDDADNCLGLANDQADADGDGTGDACDDPVDTGEPDTGDEEASGCASSDDDDDASGCGCATANAAPPLAVLLGLLASRRRRAAV